MQWLWLIPSLAFGVYLYFTTGQAYGLIFGGFAAVSSLLGMVFQNRRGAVDSNAPVHFSTDGRRIAIGDRILPKAEWRWKPEWRSSVYRHLESVNSGVAAAQAISAQVSGSLAVGHGLAFLGFAGSRKLEVCLSDEGAHAIVVGATGAGKSQLLTTWLVSLCQSNSPETLQIIGIDYKGGSALAELAGTPWCAGLHTDLTGTAPAFLASLPQLLQEREVACVAAGVSRTADLPREQLLPSLYVVIDELQALLADPALLRPLESVAARGRSLDVHIVATAQSLSGVSRGLLANLGLRIAVGKPDPVDLAQLGYSRSEMQPMTASKFQNVGFELGDALLISPKRQVQFRFPSGGVVGFERLRPNVVAESLVELTAETAPQTTPNPAPNPTPNPPAQTTDSRVLPELSNEIAQPKPVFASESVAETPKVFEFRIGL